MQYVAVSAVGRVGERRREEEGEQGMRGEVNFRDQENIKLTDQKVGKCLSQDLVKK